MPFLKLVGPQNPLLLLTDAETRLYCSYCYRASQMPDLGEIIMKTMLKGAALLPICLFLTATAQADNHEQEVFVYGTYSVCDLTQQERVDEIFEKLDKPIYDAAVADGTITSYSYYAHHTGGKWRRGMFYVGSSIEMLLDAQKKIGEQIDAKNAKMSMEASKICNKHEDYIWRRVAGGAGTSEPGKAVFSTYYVCDSREAQADALVTQVFAPAYDKLVADGDLTSWGYLEHIVGGHVRRVATMTSADMKSLMAARAKLTAALMDNPLGETFTNICDAHDDYMWEVKASGRQ